MCPLPISPLPQITAHYYLSPHSIKIFHFVWYWVSTDSGNADPVSQCQLVNVIYPSCRLTIPDLGMVYHLTPQSSLYTDVVNGYYPEDTFATCHTIVLI